ncbi:MAG: YidC/Oxa1 family membrane protein insertase [Bacilli bacterium]|nr:YidC/Oxa1 family membrane protein insertase [Bacilli bacterium]
MNKKIKILVILLLTLSLTGCTKYLKVDNKIVQNEETGQNLTKNILCAPEDENIIVLYNEYNKKVTTENKVNLEELPKCINLNPTTGEYEGIWTTIFVKPLAWLIIQLGNILKSYGLAIIISTILIRGIMYPFTKKQALQSENLKEAQKDLNKLEQKYVNKTDSESMMQKSQEMMLIYKKFNINPLSGCLFAFIQIPLFFAFLEAINRIPVIFEENFLGLFQLGTSPFIAVFTNHQYYYLIFIILIAGATYYSFKLNSGAGIGNKAGSESQMKIMTNIMVVFMTITAFSISTGIAIYWTISNLFTIVQNLLVKRGKKNARNN